MDIKVTDTFGKSLKNLINREKWHWKTWDFLRYDMPNFFKNVWRFRKDLYDYRWYSGSHAVMPFMKTAIDHMTDRIEKYGLEVDEPRLKKVAKMKRASYLLECFINDSFIDLAEEELGELKNTDFEFRELDETRDNPFGEKDEKLYEMINTGTEEDQDHNSKVFDRSRQLEQQMWEELWRILQGQDHNQFLELSNQVKESGEDTDDTWNKWFDGSDLRGWWD